MASVPFELEDLLGEDLGLGYWVMLMQWFKKQMKQILSDKQYKKYEEIFDLTVRNTVKINIERITSARKHMTGMMNTKS